MSAKVVVKAKKIARLRREAGLYQYQLGEACGWSQQYQSKLERGQAALTVEAAVRLAGGLGVSLDTFLAALGVSLMELAAPQRGEPG